MASDRDWKKCTDDKEKYQLYLASREWCKLREKVRKRAYDKCERCLILPMDACHHLTYANKYNEKLEDLQAICTPCHEFTHSKSDFDPQANSNLIQWFALSCDKNFDRWGDADMWWLQPGFITVLLKVIFDRPTLLPVFQLWLSLGFADCGVSEAVAFYKDYKNDDGDTVADCGEIPTAVDIGIYKMFSNEQYAFYSWLRWGGPTEQPIGSASAFARCKELAVRTHEKSRLKSDEFGSYGPLVDF